MSPAVRSGPSREKASLDTDGSLLPSHRDNASTPQSAVKPAPSFNESLEASYHVADAKLLRLEEELDVLYHCARLLREQRAEIALKRLQYLDGGATELEGADQLIDEYLKLAKKGKFVDDMIKTIKEECAAIRSECDYIFSRLRTPSGKRRKTFRERRSLATGRPESGFVDRNAIADRIILAESTATNVAAVVGAFGAGITYTTLFSASRGRLDLISWAFTCFLIVVINSTALQVFALPRHGQLARIFRSDYHGSVESRIVIYTVLVGIPLVTGFILLGVSVATLIQGRTPVIGSEIAIKASGYLPVAILGYFVLIIVAALGAIAMGFLRRHLRPGPKELDVGDVRLPASAIFPLQEKLHFLPEGPGYIRYRSKHRSTSKA